MRGFEAYIDSDQLHPVLVITSYDLDISVLGPFSAEDSACVIEQLKAIKWGWSHKGLS